MDKNSEYLAISPIDGRYRGQLEKLADYFSEKALFYYRTKVEIFYLIALSNESKIKELKRFTPQERKFLENIYLKFSTADVEKIKDFEKVTKHDMKAVEYFIKDKIKNSRLPRLKKSTEFIHFCLTSEDVNNLAYSLMLKKGVNNVYVPVLEDLIKKLLVKARKYKKAAMLSRTHGQPATPTTFGKELAVFVARLRRQENILRNIKLLGKFNGATGNWAAHKAAYPDVNWPFLSKHLIQSLELEQNLFTTQIESHDSAAEMYDTLRRINNIILDFDQDMWMYISRDLLSQKSKKGEVGSSTMPHKTNPINFENSEGNLQIANTYLAFLSDKLMKSRMQRDLSDSTVLRNQGMAVAHSLLGIKSTVAGLNKIEVNKQKMVDEINDNPEVLAEAIQVVMRKAGVDEPYEKLKELTKGKEVTMETIYEFVDTLDIPSAEKTKLKKLKPENYYGLSEQIVNWIK
ncbi:adenylosuccinate lyase [Patescibacteria group bacterium]|nr:adenylosuccinate lyase [Patescibacteria group bacterium]